MTGLVSANTYLCRLEAKEEIVKEQQMNIDAFNDQVDGLMSHKEQLSRE